MSQHYERKGCIDERLDDTIRHPLDKNNLTCVLWRAAGGVSCRAVNENRRKQAIQVLSIWSQHTALPAETVILGNRREVVSKWSQIGVNPCPDLRVP